LFILPTGRDRGLSYRNLPDRIEIELMSSVIMDVMNVEQAKIAEEAGACAVMALGSFPAVFKWRRTLIIRANPRQHQTRWWCRTNGKLVAICPWDAS